MDYNVVLNASSIVVSIGAAFYLYETAHVLKGGILARGMTILAASPLLIALSALFELLSEAGLGAVYGIIHDLMRFVFIVVLLIGARSIVLAWRKLP